MPTNFTATATSATIITLSWTASTDNVAVTGYEVRRDGVLIGSPVGTTFNDTGRAASTTYSYTVLATDAAGNDSGTASAQATTPAASGGGSSSGGGGGGGRLDLLTLLLGVALLGMRWRRRREATGAI